MLNYLADCWILTLDRYPEFEREVFILIEEEVVYDPKEEIPYIRRAKLEDNTKKDGNFHSVASFRLLDFNPDEDDYDILHQSLTVSAWRYVEIE